MNVVKLPEMKYEGLTAAEALLKFYADLGWEADKHNLNPKKVKLSEQDHLAFSDALKLLDPDNDNGVILMLLNNGPSCGYACVNQGTVRLYEGWIEEP